MDFAEQHSVTSAIAMSLLMVAFLATSGGVQMPFRTSANR
jgi:hypothetical protein